MNVPAPSPTKVDSQQFFRTCSLAFGWWAILVGASVLVGWSLGIEFLKSVGGERVAMNPVTAVTFMLCGGSLIAFVRQRPGRRLRLPARLAAGGSLMIGLLILGSYAVESESRIDRLLFRRDLGVNLMAPNTAFFFVLVGIALLTLHQRGRRHLWLIQTPATITAVGSLVAVLGYAFGTTGLYGLSSHIPMALNTAATFLAIALGILCAAPGSRLVGLLSGSAAGAVMARRLLPIAVTVPILLGWLRLLGEQAGWYDTEFGVSLYAAATLLVLLAAIAWTGEWLNRLDAQRRSAEDALRKTLDELESRVEQRTAALAAANRELEDKNRENEMFVYSVSHDLRSPLVNLQGFSRELELAATDLRELFVASDLPSAARERGLQAIDVDMGESIRFILSAVTRLGNIIDSLLRLSRVGRVVYRHEPLDLVGIVQRSVDSFAGTISDRAAEVVVRDLPPVTGDSTAIEQVFSNLLGNALNYLEPDRPGQIEIGSAGLCPGEDDDGRTLQLYYVRDNGLGIAEAHQAKIFQAFQRAHPQLPGEGMGLAIVRRIVERHAGRVWVESAVGRGSTFYVALPANPARAAEFGERPPRAASQRSTKGEGNHVEQCAGGHAGGR